MQTIRVINYHGLSTELPAVWIDALERAGVLRVLSRAGDQKGHTTGAPYDVLEFPAPADVESRDGRDHIAGARSREWANDLATYLDDELVINAVAAPKWCELSCGESLCHRPAVLGSHYCEQHQKQTKDNLVDTCFDIARSQLGPERV